MMSIMKTDLLGAAHRVRPQDVKRDTLRRRLQHACNGVHRTWWGCRLISAAGSHEVQFSSSALKGDNDR